MPSITNHYRCHASHYRRVPVAFRLAPPPVARAETPDARHTPRILADLAIHASGGRDEDRP